MIEDGKRVTAGGAGFQRHITLIADIDLIARHIAVEENERNGVASTFNI